MMTMEYLLSVVNPYTLVVVTVGEITITGYAMNMRNQKYLLNYKVAVITPTIRELKVEAIQ